MTQHVKANNLGTLFHAPIDLILESTSVLQPDLVVEILSPPTNRSDRVTKPQLYARHHIPAYWIADPELETLEIYQLDNNSFHRLTTLQGDSAQKVPPFTGLKFSAKDIFG